jgi:hypothetical protein
VIRNFVWILERVSNYCDGTPKGQMVTDKTEKVKIDRQKKTRPWELASKESCHRVTWGLEFLLSYKSRFRHLPNTGRHAGEAERARLVHGNTMAQNRAREWIMSTLNPRNTPRGEVRESWRRAREGALEDGALDNVVGLKWRLSLRDGRREPARRNLKHETAVFRHAPACASEVPR